MFTCLATLTACPGMIPICLNMLPTYINILFGTTSICINMMPFSKHVIDLFERPMILFSDLDNQFGYVNYLFRLSKLNDTLHCVDCI